MREKRLAIETPRGAVSASRTGPGKDAPLLVLGHGAGRDMDDPLLVGFAEALATAAAAR